MIPPTNKFTYTLVDTSIGDQYLNSRLVPNFIYPGSLNYTKSITFVNYIVKSFSVFVKNVMTIRGTGHSSQVDHSTPLALWRNGRPLNEKNCNSMFYFDSFDPQRSYRVTPILKCRLKYTLSISTLAWYSP